MKKQNALFLGLFAIAMAFTSCNKNECHDCHYDGPNGEVELGEKCGSELEDLEANGYNVDSVNYTVHCHGH